MYSDNDKPVAFSLGAARRLKDAAEAVERFSPGGNMRPRGEPFVQYGAGSNVQWVRVTSLTPAVDGLLPAKILQVADDTQNPPTWSDFSDCYAFAPNGETLTLGTRYLALAVALAPDSTGYTVFAVQQPQSTATGQNFFSYALNSLGTVNTTTPGLLAGLFSDFSGSLADNDTVLMRVMCQYSCTSGSPGTLTLDFDLWNAGTVLSTLASSGALPLPAAGVSSATIWCELDVWVQTVDQNSSDLTCNASARFTMATASGAAAATVYLSHGISFQFTSGDTGTKFGLVATFSASGQSVSAYKGWGARIAAT